MKRYIRTIAFLLIFITLFLVSCEREPIYHASGKPEDDVAVMGTVDEPYVDNGRKKVAITYDDGPHNIRTKNIVDELAKYGFHATFFIIGNRVDGTNYNGRDALTYAAEKGNEIGIHGYTHTAYYNSCSDDIYDSELKNTEKAIKDALNGTSVRLMRPVGGFITDERVKQCKYSVILWNVDSEDWKYKYTSDDTEESEAEKVQNIVDNVMNNVSDGSIILMHDIYESTYDATVVILERLYAEGYDVVTVSELLSNELSAGEKFSRRGE